MFPRSLLYRSARYIEPGELGACCCHLVQPLVANNGTSGGCKLAQELWQGFAVAQRSAVGYFELLKRFGPAGQPLEGGTSSENELAQSGRPFGLRPLESEQSARVEEDQVLELGERVERREVGAPAAVQRDEARTGPGEVEQAGLREARTARAVEDGERRGQGRDGGVGETAAQGERREMGREGEGGGEIEQRRGGGEIERGDGVQKGTQSRGRELATTRQQRHHRAKKLGLAQSNLQIPAVATKLLALHRLDKRKQRKLLQTFH